MNFGDELIDLNQVRIYPELLNCVSREIAFKYRILPVAERFDCLYLVRGDVNDLAAIDDLAYHLNRDIQICAAEPGQLDEFIQQLYGDGQS